MIPVSGVTFQYKAGDKIHKLFYVLLRSEVPALDLNERNLHGGQ
jgi:hypothetical protein